MADTTGSVEQLRNAIVIGTNALAVAGDDPDLLYSVGHCCLRLNIFSDDPHAADDAIQYAIRANAAADRSRQDILELAVLAAFNLIRTATGPLDLENILPLVDQSLTDDAGTLAFRCAIDATLSANSAYFHRLTSARTLGERSLEIGADPAAAAIVHDSLGTACYRRFRVTKDPALLDAAITHGSQYAELAEDPSAEVNLDNIAVAQINLATRLLQRYESSRHRPDLDRAIDYAHRSLADRSGIEIRLLRRAGILIGLLCKRAEDDQSPASCVEAVRIGQQYLSLAQRSAMDVGFYQNFAHAARECFDAEPSEANLEVAITALEAASAFNIDNVGRRNLISLLITRYERTGNESALRRAVVLADFLLRDSGAVAGQLERWLDAALAEDSDLEVTPAQIADAARGVAANPDEAASVALRSFSVNAAIDHVDELVSEAAQISHDSGDTAATELMSIALELREIHLKRGDHRSIDEAVRLGEESIRRHPSDEADRPMQLSNLAVIHRNRYSATGQPPDLDRAIELGREAAQLHTGDPAEHGLLSNLAGALRSRFDRLGRIVDLNEAIALLRTESAALGPFTARYAANLGAALLVRYRRLKDRQDLDEAIALLTSVENSETSTGVIDSRILSSLSGALLEYASLTGNAADLQSALAAADRAAVTSRGKVEYATNLSAIADGLRRAAAQLLQRSPSDAALLLRRAVTIQRQALAATLENTPMRAVLHLNAGSMLADWHQAEPEVAPIEDAVAEYRAGLMIATADPWVRAMCGKAAAELASELGDWAAATEFHQVVAELIPVVVGVNQTHTDRHHRLRQLQDLGGQAVRAAVGALHTDPDNWSSKTVDHLRTAWELLEASRAIEMGQSLDAKLDARALRLADAQLADKATELAAELASGVATNSPTLRWQILVEHIRMRPGLEHYGQPASFERLAARAAGRTVVAIVMSSSGCGALLLGSTGPDYLPLPGLSLERAVMWVNRYLRAVHGDAGGLSSSDELLQVLEWMWGEITGPVLDHLGLGSAPPDDYATWPRVWWLPTGLTSVLPLHASGRHRLAERADGSTVLDRVVSSYTTAIRVLDAVDELPPADGRLVVGVNHAPGMRPLRLAEHEAQLVQDLLDPDGKACLGSDGQEMLAQVSRELATSSWVHFSCHASADQTDPMQSYLALADGNLNAANIANLEILKRQLAYLSACNTAFGSIDLLDEQVHIASAFQLAGFRHVIATLWPIQDGLAPLVARDIYQAMLSNNEPPALAVHMTIRELRDQHTLKPELWASHIHFGH